ncbi:hypothetical protein RF11_13612 [Thelohanellus kitauei]|uniref:Sortilin N-terminal domain-containing protein n=1 Tax=Thelohanellus kitauei TaxID=669202 RepID=A0A0C2JB18_THEKT|nr:hypothetical protein RF11_13612 [Thelohanellus kitauei]
MNKNNKITRTYVSFDDGKNFVPLELKGAPYCLDNNCGIELDLECSKDFIKNNFPEKWIAKFKGTSHRKDSKRRNMFVSFDGGKYWKILNSKIDKLIIINHGSLLFGAERSTGGIWYSYDRGREWYKESIGNFKLIDIIPLESPNNLVIATLEGVGILILKSFTYRDSSGTASKDKRFPILPKIHLLCAWMTEN